MSGVANMRAGIDSLKRLNGAIRDLPIRIRTAVARDAADVINKELRAEFAAGKTVYDTPRPLSVAGKPLTLVKTGRTKADLAFVTVGTILRAQLGSKYGRYLVGKYKVLPMSLPAGWRSKLNEIVSKYVAQFALEHGGTPS